MNDSRDDCCAGPCSAGQGFASTSFPDTQTNIFPVDNLHVTGVDQLRKALMLLDQWTLCRDRC